MTERYLDHGVYASIAATPTWGQAQEGDGNGTGASTVATVAIDLSGATAAAGNTLSVMGAVLTCVASGASTNQFNAGSGATLVANLVTAINRSSNSATVAAQATGWPTPLIQNAVFARAGTPTTTLEIMTRAGSSTYNSSTVAQSGMTGATGPWTFSGGASGAWGWLLNVAAAFGSALSIYGYGAWCATRGIAGALNNGDNVRVRSNKTIATTAGGTIVFPVLGTAAAPVRFEIDDGTTWPADGSTPVLTISNSATSGSTFSLQQTATLAVNVVGKQYASGQRSLVLLKTGANTSDNLQVRPGGGLSFENTDFLATGSAYVSFADASLATNAALVSVFSNCRLQWPTQNASRVFVSITSGGSSRMVFRGGSFQIVAPTDVQPAVITPGSSGSPQIDLEGVSFAGFQAGSTLIASTSSLTSQSMIVSRNCVFGGVTRRGPSFFGSQLPVSTYSVPRGYFESSQFGTRDFAVNAPQGYAAWNGAQQYPTLGAVLFDGVTPWSIRAIPSTTAGAVGPLGPFDLPRIGKINSLADGVRTITVEILLEKGLAWNKSHIALLLEYMGTDDVLRTVDTYDAAGGALTTSTAAWTNLQTDPADSQTRPTFNDGGVVYLNRYKFSVTTPTAIKSGTEISALVRLCATVDNTSRAIFVDPELGVA